MSSSKASTPRIKPKLLCAKLYFRVQLSQLWKILKTLAPHQQRNWNIRFLPSDFNQPLSTLFILIMMAVFSRLLDNIQNPPDWLRAALFISLFGLYEPLCMTFGCTLGNYIKNIRVRSRDDHSAKISILQALVRFLLKVCLGWISFLFIHSNYEKRALHDMASGSVMLKK